MGIRFERCTRLNHAMRYPTARFLLRVTQFPRIPSNVSLSGTLRLPTNAIIYSRNRQRRQCLDIDSINLKRSIKYNRPLEVEDLDR